MSGTRKIKVNEYSKDPNLETKKQKAREAALRKNNEIQKYAWTQVTQKSPPPTDEKGAIDTRGRTLKYIQRLYEYYDKNPEKVIEHVEKEYGNYETKDAKKLEDKDSVNFGSPSPEELSPSPLPKTRKKRIPRMSKSSRSSSAPLPQNKTTKKKHNRPVIYISKESRSSSSGRSSRSSGRSSRSSSSRSREPEKLFEKRHKPKGSFDDVRHSGHANNRAYIVEEIKKSQSL
jgi:hypothetical protein